MQRQTERRARFQSLITTMPYWETWTEPWISKDGELIERGNYQRISRCTRRDMARQRAKREFRVAYNLPEPRD